MTRYILRVNGQTDIPYDSDATSPQEVSHELLVKRSLNHTLSRDNLLIFWNGIWTIEILDDEAARAASGLKPDGRDTAGDRGLRHPLGCSSPG